MRILLVNKFYDPTIGGVESVVKQHAAFLREQGHEVTVLCCSDRFAVHTLVEEHNGVRVVRCASFGTFMSMPLAPALSLHLLRLLFWSELVIYHLPFPLATVSALFQPVRRPVIVFWHSDIVQQKRLKPIVQFFQRALCRRARRVLTTSPQLLEFSEVIRDFRDKAAVVPLSVPTGGRSIAAPDCRPTGLPELPERYALFLGRLCYYKGVDVLLKALSDLSKSGNPFPVVLVGDGPLKTDVEAAIQGHDLPQVIFIDRHVDEAEKHWLLANAWFLLFPSTQPSEAFGIVQLEAMYHGVPVINTSLPTGVPWVSQDQETGLTIAPDDVPALTRAFLHLMENPSTRERWAKNAVARVCDHFSDDRASELLNKEIERATAGSVSVDQGS
ncbi:group 1 glycosyl transferase [Alcanivorax balearicus MACL04]|uniref:Group 1 glycosyl transferase n=1 Tax=Alloalcanivorax balearicus MACL04 TaxID=1177182 RepID=A0ABT2R101_9GAMM|nr:glycosyltransferase [Alloalcanivorax balearicus]MCU5783449.1 group 1 glycosyl transferase [Alloalcanivorax balearicus MACL04]